MSSICTIFDKMSAMVSSRHNEEERVGYSN